MTGTPVTLTDNEGRVRFEGLQVGGGGGSLPSGAGSPVGVVTPSGIGGLYIDTTTGALYIASGVTSADWVVVGGLAASTGDATGFSKVGHAVCGAGGVDKDTPLNGIGVALTDAYAQWNGNGAGLYHEGDGTDGHQGLFYLNDAGRTELHDANATMTVGAGGIKFPTADPHIAGAWWDNNGVLTKSSG